VIRAALRSEHGRVEVEAKTSNYPMVQEVATTYLQAIRQSDFFVRYCPLRRFARSSNQRTCPDA
jgi:hypothetical protein